ncbi:MAG: DinB family protein [Gemmatimonadetes bacterium]|nr:DinB family protein [Gemmatimonadota bacterium]MBK7784813.1 DinB family protein [Gemmatimonadota bacterium]
MSIAQSLLPEYDHEMATTRTHLERAPFADWAWKPHAKSMTLGALASHLVEVPSWVPPTLTRTELDLNPPGGPAYTSPTFASVAALLAAFDANAKQGRAALAATSDADFMVPWSLKSGGQVLMTMPRIAVMRSFVMNHLIHHRGQFTVYLRLRDVPLPQTYGPSADTQ